MIKIRHLRVRGISRSYDVSFANPDGSTRPLSVIAGEISTGKSSILDFIDYCLGASNHPRQIEVQRQARFALVEIELDGVRVVVERQLFNMPSFVWVHETTIDRIDEPHTTRRVVLGPPGDATSLNWMLLRESRLEGVVLKEAPTKAESATDRLSFRDVMDLAYLEDKRLLAGRLLHEYHHMKHLKLRQLVEVVFGVHDQELATMGERIARLEQERNAQRREVASLSSFLEEQKVRPRDELDRERAALARRSQDLRWSLAQVETTMAGATTEAESARASYATQRRATSRMRAQLRDRKALMARLLPLRGQYVEDERKLVFFEEARRLFDPLSVTVCPACLASLPEPPTIVDGACSLCREAIRGREHEQSVNVEAERRGIRRRLNEIEAYIADVEKQISDRETQLTEANQAEALAAGLLNENVAERLAPFIADRERIINRRQSVARALGNIERETVARDSVERREGELAALEGRIAQLRAEQADRGERRPDREMAIRNLSGQFVSLLERFGFPKMNDPEPPYLSTRDLMPHVRGVPYHELRSRGAITLVALAWQLAIFEEAIEQGRPHPGFLLIDSPQSGLKPAQEDPDDPEFTATEIAARVWYHIRSWSEDHPDVQLIVVDNLPPAAVNPFVVVRYSGRADVPPYGFIDNETDAPRPA